MNFKEKMILLGIIFIVAIVLIINFLLIFPPKSLAVNQHKEYFVNKYNINKKDLELVEYNKEHTKKYCNSECFSTEKVKFPRYSIFEYNGTSFTVVNNHDDYLYEELYNGVRMYYSNKLNIEKEKIYITRLNQDEENYYDYINFLYYNNNIKEITDNTIEEFLSQIESNEILVDIKLEINDNQNEYINKVQNNKYKLNYGEKITLYTYQADLDIVDCSTNIDDYYTEPLEYNFFKCLMVSSNGKEYLNDEYKIISFQGYETNQSDDSNIIYFKNGGVKQ